MLVPFYAQELDYHSLKSILRFFFFICRIVVSTVVLVSINIHFDPCTLDEIVALGHIKI